MRHEARGGRRQRRMKRRGGWARGRGASCARKGAAVGGARKGARKGAAGAKDGA